MPRKANPNPGGTAKAPRIPKPKLEELPSTKRFLAAPLVIDGDDVDMNTTLGYLRLLSNSLPASRYADDTVIIFGSDFTEARVVVKERTKAAAEA